MLHRYILLAYIIIINLTAFSLYGYDKRQAVRKERRIKEITLILAALLGGSAGALAAMAVFRHKTRHDKFKYGVPSLLILNSLVFFYLYMLFKP
jgi:uncharacterized membrane protein YsdA (DUF1294 family)